MGAGRPHPEAPIAQFNEQEMAELRALSGQAFDRRWLDVFSSHHMSAVMMANVALAGAGDAQEIAQKIHDERVKDIEEMNALRQRIPSG